MRMCNKNENQMSVMRENFRLLREEKNWSVEELSQRSGIDAEILTGIETGEDFDIEFLVMLCQIYHLKPHKIFLPIE